MMQPDVKTEIDFPEFFGSSKAMVMLENPSESRLGMICDDFFTTLETIAPHAGELDAGIRMVDGVFGADWASIRILDLGEAGMLTGLKLHFKGFRQITIADEPSMFLDFLRFLCDKYGLAIPIKTLDELFQFPGDPFEMVICQSHPSSFGHPVNILDRIRSCMTKSGFLYLPQIINCHPLFIESRALQTLESQGLVPMWDYPEGYWRGFQRVR